MRSSGTSCGIEVYHSCYAPLRGACRLCACHSNVPEGSALGDPLDVAHSGTNGCCAETKVLLWHGGHVPEMQLGHASSGSN